ncbi:uncharacterized protein BP01DRAFT_384919 [Aspergillus saccharolyticus JOP 1030-1]|uniref:DUF6594 domain-containing protein n=1 Tax=Aspergillus saccharolyticus JOP 1030-1 TaxID=1450539 RepID=A0A318Z786_9EURO|nr:hypothetical protein BP01DRAFT_384919 [Aspergillus saccharolyticus JOP 1030-1]PYH42969.1 hypothetical protein BP01DRAFT_384919 [Aspergillus saccharolyticus JOP 1030-1]
MTLFQTDSHQSGPSEVGSASATEKTCDPSTSTHRTAPEATDTTLTQEEIDQKPWKYLGYHVYSTFLSSDRDFCNFRRFDRLNVRVLLLMQDEIVQLEEELDEIDRYYSQREVADENNGSLRHDTRKEHRFILQYMKILNRAATADRDRESLRNWLHNYKGAIWEKEQQYIEKVDLIPLVPKDRSPLRRIFERSSRFRLSRIWRRGPAPSTLPLHVRERIHLYSDKSIDFFVNLTTTVVGLAMLIAPLWILAYTTGPATKLAVITVFTLAFLALVSLGTTARPYEAIGATAAYSAIVMVFLQLGSS